MDTYTIVGGPNKMAIMFSQYDEETDDSRRKSVVFHSDAGEFRLTIKGATRLDSLGDSWMLECSNGVYVTYSTKTRKGILKQ